MRRLTFCLLCILGLVPGTLTAGDKPLPRDLALVPPDGLYFAHVRLQDIYKSDHFKDWRTSLNMAGAKALAVFDSRFFPAPSSLDRVTLFLSRNSFEPIVVITTSKAIDKAAFLKYTVPEATEEKGPAGSIHVYTRKKLEFYFANDTTLVVGPMRTLREFLTAPKNKTGKLSEAIQLANSGPAAVLAVNIDALPTELLAMMLKQAPPPTQTLLQPFLKAKLATIAVDLRKEGQVDVRLAFADAKQTGDGDLAAREGIKFARALIDKKREEMKTLLHAKTADLEDLPAAAMSLFMLGMLNRVDEYLASGPITRKDLSLQASFKIPRGSSQAALLGSAAAMGFFSEIDFRSNSKNRPYSPSNNSRDHLSQIALAMHSYHDAHMTLPPAAICDKNGKPLLSWRVAILPYIGQDFLYKEFKLDEPWDSEHNKKLIPRMPNVYTVPPNAAAKEPGQTHTQVFVGNGAAFELSKGVKLTDITDGASNTIMCIEASQSVPWTKPEDLSYDPKKPLPKLPNFYGTGYFVAAFCDGSVRSLSNDISEPAMRAYITRAAGDKIDDEFDR